jgi:arylsulfatase A-like enzyme
LPTICQVTGTAAPEDRPIDGRNIWPVLTESAGSPHEYVAWSEGPQLAIRKGKWKLVLNGITHDGTPEGDKPLQGDDAVFLSDLENDPGESKNLRHEHSEIVDELQTLAHEWKRSIDSNASR